MSSGYQLKGQEVEACDCASICPCVFGEEPEHGSCFGILARHVEKGTIGDVDVSWTAGSAAPWGSWRS